MKNLSETQAKHSKKLLKIEDHVFSKNCSNSASWLGR